MGASRPPLSIADTPWVGAPELLGPPRCTCLPVDQRGRGGWSNGRAATGQGERIKRPCDPVSERVGQTGGQFAALASHRACRQEDGWFLPHGGGGVERAGGSCSPWIMGHR